MLRRSEVPFQKLARGPVFSLAMQCSQCLAPLLASQILNREKKRKVHSV